MQNISKMLRINIFCEILLSTEYCQELSVSFINWGGDVIRDVSSSFECYDNTMFCSVEFLDWEKSYNNTSDVRRGRRAIN